MMASRKALIILIRQWNETKLSTDEHKVYVYWQEILNYLSTYVGSKPVPLSQEQIETSVYQQNHKYFFLIKTLDYTRVKQKVGIF